MLRDQPQNFLLAFRQGVDAIRHVPQGRPQSDGVFTRETRWKPLFSHN
jgi:hypothetical protein